MKLRVLFSLILNYCVCLLDLFRLYTLRLKFNVVGRLYFIQIVVATRKTDSLMQNIVKVRWSSKKGLNTLHNVYSKIENKPFQSFASCY